ncbi:multiubiquitin domain-containing protein [Holophaga foetida]|uniref:multiubiquitin domain-containing protein n=1 Tax=Holophaga foetida TaxID=35839 RepID=UPI000304B108|nr:multiubiquitin domain-containing protein [Holophaga foetida]
MTNEHEISKSEEAEVDILSYAGRGELVPHAPFYRVVIDGEKYRVETSTPTGKALLNLAGKIPCNFDLIAEFAHHENDVIDPDEVIDLRTRGLKGFITAHKEIVTIFVQSDPYRIERGGRTVAEILALVGKTPDGYILLQEKNGPPVPVPEDRPVSICGGELFFVQVKSGGSSR